VKFCETTIIFTSVHPHTLLTEYIINPHASHFVSQLYSYIANNYFPAETSITENTWMYNQGQQTSSIMAPQFHEAFATLKDDESRPPGPTPLLEDKPRFCFVPALHAARPAADDLLDQFTCTPDDVIELRISLPRPTLKAIDTDMNTDMDIDDNVTYHTIVPSTTVPDATYHCTNLFDLLIILRCLTPSQRQSIHTFKVRWYTAECALWEYYHPDHASKVSSGAFEMLTGLRKIMVDCEGKNVQEIQEMKGELERWVGIGVEVEMVGGKKAVWKESWLGMRGGVG
jgi:hypothetical protein